jgi:HK97 family phage prohead protease
MLFEEGEMTTKRLETKDLEFKFTVGGEDADAGQFTGYASIFDMVDTYGDAVQRGAFKKTLKEKQQFPLLWSHDISKPIGIISGSENKKGLEVTGQLNLDVQLAREIRSLMAQGAVTGLSIGYNVVKELIDTETGIRQLKEVNLWEISPCVFQSCPEAVVDDVKSKEPGEEPEKSTPTIKPETLHLIEELTARIEEYLNS